MNITNIQGVTVVGEGNVVNTQFGDLARALDELDTSIAKATDLTDEQKLDSAGDLSTIRTQISKKNPDRSIIRAAWESLKKVATAASLADSMIKVGSLLSSLL